jgi:hypothetical protein
MARMMMNHEGWRGLSAQVGTRDQYASVRLIEADTNVNVPTGIGMMLKGPRGGVIGIADLTVEQADELAQGLTWLVAQARGFRLDTRAQSVTCSEGDEHGVQS